VGYAEAGWFGPDSYRSRIFTASRSTSDLNPGRILAQRSSSTSRALCVTEELDVDIVPEGRPIERSRLEELETLQPDASSAGS